MMDASNPSDDLNFPRKKRKTFSNQNEKLIKIREIEPSTILQALLEFANSGRGVEE